MYPCEKIFKFVFSLNKRIGNICFIRGVPRAPFAFGDAALPFSRLSPLAMRRSFLAFRLRRYGSQGAARPRLVGGVMGGRAVQRMGVRGRLLL